MQQELIQHVLDCFDKKTNLSQSLDEVICHSLKTNQRSSQAFDLKLNVSERSPVYRIQQWRKFLSFLLVFDFQKAADKKREELNRLWYQLHATSLGPEFQLEQAYLHLCALLLDLPYSSPEKLVQSEEGYTPLYILKTCHWLNAPVMEWHAELGIIWAILAQKLQSPMYKDGVHQLATWQLNNVNHHLVPFKGFLSSFYLCSYENLLLKQGILFHLASIADENTQWSYIAKQHFSVLIKNAHLNSQNCSLLPIQLLKWTSKFFAEEKTSTKPQLNSTFFDSSNSFVGIRNAQSNLVLSLKGCNNGFGSLQHEDVLINAFGPQKGLLGDSKCFGFLGHNAVQIQPTFNPQLDIENHQFHLKGTVSLPSVKKVTPNFLDIWQHSDDWLNCSFDYAFPTLNMKVSPLVNETPTYMIFYVTAQKCLIDGKERILPHSLNQYQGSAHAIHLIGEKHQIQLSNAQNDLELKVIPLEGGSSFWGSNYLIAYLLNNKYSNFAWEITTL